MKIYRLICRNTYEREMFDKASLKLGLDKAVLQSMNSTTKEGITPVRAIFDLPYTPDGARCHGLSLCFNFDALDSAIDQEGNRGFAEERCIWRHYGGR